jgi:hypothetical protein
MALRDPPSRPYARRDERALRQRDCTARGGRRQLRLSAGRRIVGMEQRGAGDEPGGRPPRRHALRPEPHPSHARCHAAAHAGRGEHRDRGQHSRERRPLLGQPARRRRRDRRLAARRSRDARSVPRAHEDPGARVAARAEARWARPARRRSPRSTGRPAGRVVRRRRAVRGRQVRRVRLRGDRPDPPDDDLRRPLDAAGRGQGLAADRGGACPHQGRRDRARPLGSGPLLRRHPVHREPPDRVERAGEQLDPRLRPHPRPRRRHDRAGPWPAHRQGRRAQGARLLGVPSLEAARDIALDGFSHWRDAERVAVNVDTIYRELSGDPSKPDPLALLARMARFAAPAG